MSNIIVTIIICYTLYKIIVGHSSINIKKVKEAVVQTAVATSNHVIDEIHINYLNFKNKNPEFKHIDFETFLLNLKIENQNDGKTFLDKLDKKEEENK